MLLLFWKGTGGGTPPPVVTPATTGAGGIARHKARHKARRKFVIDGKVYEGTEEDAKRILYALLDANRVEEPKRHSKPIRRKRVERIKIVSDTPPVWIDTHKYQSMLLQARQRDDEWMSNVLYEVWREAMQAREDDDEEAILWLM